MNQGKKINKIIDHPNLEEKIWYGTDILISNNLKDNAPVPISRCPFFALVACTKGELSYKVNFKCFQWQATTLFAITPNAVIEHLGHSEDSEGCVIAISPKFMKNLQLYASMKAFGNLTNKPFLKLTEEDTETFHLYFQLCYRLASQKQNSINDILIANVLQSFFNYFLNKYEVQESQQPANTFKNRSEYICSEFLKLVNLYAVNEREISFYASQLFLSEKYLSNVVKQTTQRTPSDWIRGAVIQQATALLFDLSKSIRQISDELNFSSPSHFNTYFKKEMGCTPLQYRSNLGQ